MKRVQSVGQGVPGSPFYWSFYFDPGATDSDAQNCDNWVRQFWLSAADMFSDNLTIGGTGQVDTINPATGDITASEAVTPHLVNGNATDLLPLVTQGLMRWRTGVYLGGRAVLGKTFLPTGPESMNTVTGDVSAVYQEAYTDAVAAADAAWPLIVQCVYSKTNGAAIARIGYDVSRQWSYLKTRRT